MHALIMANQSQLPINLPVEKYVSARATNKKLRASSASNVKYSLSCG